MLTPFRAVIWAASFNSIAFFIAKYLIGGFAGATTLYVTEFLRIPVSSTHTIAGAIIGVGAVKRLSAIRWGITQNLLIAWILTIPVSALLGALLFFLVGGLL